MSLIHKKTTPRLQAANRANSLKSTGPQTKLGKAHSSRNALKYGVFTRLSVASMKELGEPLMDSQLIPSQEDLRKIMDYEGALKRQFERKLQQLVAWRRAKGEPDTRQIVVKDE
jgi:hypothetical protein